MKLHAIPCQWRGRSFRLGGWSGSLCSLTEVAEPSGLTVPSPTGKCGALLDMCRDPYRLNPTRVNRDALGEMSAGNAAADRMLRRMVCLCRHKFWLACGYAGVGRGIFPDAFEANRYFRSHAQGDQDTLCLPRALFAAKTSRRFAEAGAVFIGVFLPSRQMHAWVIEDGRHVDPWDGIWINYQPVAMLA